MSTAEKNSDKNNLNSVRREAIFQFLFHLELPINQEYREQLIAAQNELNKHWNEFKVGLNYQLSASEEGKLLLTMKSLLEYHHILIERVEDYSRNWKLERISRVNFTILMMAIHELTYVQETPYKVVINEAIEISKKFGDKESKDFINALLDKYYKNEIA